VNLDPTSPVQVKSDTALGAEGGGVPPDELPPEDPPLEDDPPPDELLEVPLLLDDFLLSVQAGSVASINSDRSAINSGFPFLRLRLKFNITIDSYFEILSYANNMVTFTIERGWGAANRSYRLENRKM